MSKCAFNLSFCDNIYVYNTDWGNLMISKKEKGLGYDYIAFLDYTSSNDFSLYEIGNYHCPPGYSYGPVIRSRAIFHYIYSGKGRLVLENKEFLLEANQGFLIPAGKKAFYKADDSDPWSYSWLHIGGPKMLEVYKEAGLNSEQPVFIPSGDYEIITKIFDDIKNNSEKEYYCYGKLYEFSDYLVRYSINRTNSNADSQLDYIKKIINYIQLKHSEPIQVTDIANACGLNRSYLTRLFKEATGLSIQEYLMQYRMKSAMKLMEDPALSIQYISFAVGYNDVFTFSKAFKKHVGQSPSEYRKSIM